MTKTFNYLKREMWDGFSLTEKLFMWAWFCSRFWFTSSHRIPGMV